MFTFLKRPLYVLSNKLRRSPRSAEFSPINGPEEKWIADFSDPEHSSFDIKSETSYDAYQESPQPEADKSPQKNRSRQKTALDGALALGLKKANCIAWVDVPNRLYQDQVIEARLSLDSMGGYAATGIMFRIVEDATYYLALISSKGYFRLDVVRNNTPLPLIGWTEIPGLKAQTSSGDGSIDFTIIAFGSSLTFLVDDRWIAEIDDSSIPGGRIGLVLASYETSSVWSEAGAGRSRKNEKNPYVCLGKLHYLSVDSSIGTLEEFHKKWNNSPAIMAESRLLLAETLAAMGNPSAALSHIQKAWERREEAAVSVMATYTEMRTKRELLLASRMARMLGQYSRANDYINTCFEHLPENSSAKELIIEKAYIFFAMEDYAKLQKFVLEHIRKFDDPVLHSLLGYAYWNLKNPGSAAEEFDKAFELDADNGSHACNAANCYNAMDKKQQALNRYLEGGKVFLAQEKYGELGNLIPILLAADENNRDVRALAGKWAFGVEDFDRAEAELALSEKLRLKMKNKPRADPAVSFLRGLLLIRKGQRKDAFCFLEEAVRYAPKFGLFRFRLAENRYLFSGNARDAQVTKELKAALQLMPDDGWVNNFAAQISLDKGDFEAAEQYMEKAARTLGEVPAIRVNRGVLYYLRGSLDDALDILDSDKSDDPDGLMANCAGNLLVRSGDFDKADSYYRKALSIAPDNIEYICNRASCLIALGYYGQAEGLLDMEKPTPEVLELISHVAVKKGEYSRAEKISLSALDLAPEYPPSLISLGWIYCNTNRFNEMQKIITRLDKLKLDGDYAKRRDELNQRYNENIYRVIGCANCSRNWKIRRDCEPITPIRLHAMPPDKFPAGTCPVCGKTYCIGCAKKYIDSNKRFTCLKCKANLKLGEEGLKKIIYDWAIKDMPDNQTESRSESRAGPRAKKNPAENGSK